MSIYVDIEKNMGKFHLKANFEAANETISLLGASGCGKTMTLKCIAGIEKPDKGRIVIDDLVVYDSEKGINLTPQQRHVGLLFQNYALFPDMTVLQNIQAGARREKNKQHREELVQKMIDAFGLAELTSRLPSQLSGGQQQRVALARMLVSDPKILLLDEPFSALDSHLRFRMEQEVRQVMKDFGKTVILVSHDRDEVYRMTDRIAIMHDGRVEACGDKKEVFANPITRSGALLTGCKNISAVQALGENRILAVDWGIELPIADAEKEIPYVGIRMHDIREQEGEDSIRCTVVEEIENPFSFTIMLRPVESAASGMIGWQIDKATWYRTRKPEISICLPAEKILYLS